MQGPTRPPCHKEERDQVAQDYHDREGRVGPHKTEDLTCSECGAFNKNRQHVCGNCGAEWERDE